MSRSSAAALVGLLVLVAGCGGNAAGDGPDGARPDSGSDSGSDGGSGGGSGGGSDGRLVLVSGRDDHGQVLDKVVAVYAGPGSTDRVGGVADGTLARVTETDGSWLHVVSAEGRTVDGWVDDYYLRGVVHLVGPPPSCAASLAGKPVEPGLQVVVSRVVEGRALVSAADGSARGWVARDQVRELGPQGKTCGQDPPGTVRTH